MATCSGRSISEKQTEKQNRSCRSMERCFVSVANEYSLGEVSRARSARRLPAPHRIGSFHNRLHSVVLFPNIDAEFRPALNRPGMFCAALRFRTTLNLADPAIPNATSKTAKLRNKRYCEFFGIACLSYGRTVTFPLYDITPWILCSNYYVFLDFSLHVDTVGLLCIETKWCKWFQYHGSFSNNFLWLQFSNSISCCYITYLNYLYYSYSYINPE